MNFDKNKPYYTLNESERLGWVSYIASNGYQAELDSLPDGVRGHILNGLFQIHEGMFSYESNTSENYKALFKLYKQYLATL